ncbi:MaoC family dehydratase [Actinomadura sp. B10D3]|uniref:MaoC family dehydratase n=1 Tax=Actinomadura sp. B10D3 TaxID=3153557 RepID=UPI00325E554F
MSTVVSTAHDLLALVGQDLGETEWVPVDQESIDVFARVTRDEQWIHVDPVRAADGPFGTTIAHGFFTLSLCSHFFDELLVVGDTAMVVNYGLDRVRFPSPLSVGARIRAGGTLIRVDERGGPVQTVTRITIEADASTKPVCVAELVSRFYPAEAS